MECSTASAREASRVAGWLRQCEIFVLDILQPLPVEQWILLKDTLKRDWPNYAYYYYWIDNAIRWKEKTPEINITVYCPEKKYDTGVFVGISAYAIYYVLAFAFPENKKILFDCLINTEYIDWKREVFFQAVQDNFLSTVDDVSNHLRTAINLEILAHGYCKYYYKSKEDCLSVDVSIPPGFELRILKEENVHLIHELWPREEVKKNPEKSAMFISKMINLNKGIGLFRKEDNRLVSWALQTEYGGLGNVQTLNEFRRRGFAKIVTNALAKLIAQQDIDIVLFTSKTNIRSQNYFTSLGWKHINDVRFTIFKPLAN
ncbi:hypothetical protein TKK_0006702 [Trichogramma kaykai]